MAEPPHFSLDAPRAHYIDALGAQAQDNIRIIRISDTKTP